MASDDDSVLRNHYNNNETVVPSSAPAPTAAASSTITAGPSMSATSNLSSRYPGTGFTVGGGESRSPRSANTDGYTPETQPRREENPFSFKHFLNRDTSTTTASSTASSLGSSSNSNLHNNSNVSVTANAPHSNEQFKNSPNNNSNPINGDNTECTGTLSSSMPDAVPTIVSSTAASNVTPTLPTATTTSSSYQSSTGARPKVPQSILGGQQSQAPLQSSSVSASSISSLVGEGPKMKRSPRFSSFDSQASLAEFAGNTANNAGGANLKANECLTGTGLCNENPGNSMNNFFPNGADFARQQYVHRSFSNYDMDGAQSVSPHRNRISPPGGLSSSNMFHPNHLNLNSAAGRHPGGRQSSKNHQQPIGSHMHPNRPGAEYSAALPDFVQDHWIDQWYCSLDMNINSPPNSPISPVDFVEDLHSIAANPADICQTLPDFLSDGPIIHSAGRLADVAAGLPGLDSPEENSPSLQLSRLRLENERLRRELDESRLALAEQTRRAGELERRLEQERSNESAYSASLAQSMEQVEETLDQSKKRAVAAQNQVSKLKQQVKQLTAEVDTLRRENESLREDGAVGGDRVTRRPSRTQQLSRDLRRAASTAENNLRQLLTGVENLRLMAATIENMDRLDCGDASNPANPIINEEYLSDSDVDFDDFTGPAL